LVPASSPIRLSTNSSFSSAPGHSAYLGIGRGRAAEHFLPLAAAVQGVGVLHDVAGLVPQDLHALAARAAFHVLEHLAFEAGEAGVGEVEGDGDAGRRVGAEPLVRNPGMGLHQAAPAQLTIQRLHAALQPGALDRHVEILEPHLQQFVVRQVGPPGLSGLCTHGPEGSGIAHQNWPPHTAFRPTAQRTFQAIRTSRFTGVSGDGNKRTTSPQTMCGWNAF
jgi:hypothetical protein